MNEHDGPIFPLRRPAPPPPPDRESTMIAGAGDRWLMNIIWRHEPPEQFSGIEKCSCMEKGDG